MRLRVTVLVTAIAALLLAEAAGAFSTLGRRWAAGTTVVMHLELGSSSGTLIDGNRDFDVVAESALAAWNPFLNSVAFAAQRDSAAIASGNRINTVSFGDDVFGEPFGSGVIAITQTFYSPRTNTITEADVVFNRARTWNSYRGNQRSGAIDLRRVALHEFGHVLGLDHPDDHGQSVAAVMNSHVSNIDALQNDDVNGVASVYGGMPATSVPVTPPAPRNLLNAGARLQAGQSLVSPDNRFRLLYQTDGNLVLYDDVQRTAVWWTATEGTGAGLVGMQGDGNLVVYDGRAMPRWMSGTAANANSRLVLQNDGNLVVYAADGRALWDRFSNPAGFIP